MTMKNDKNICTVIIINYPPFPENMWPDEIDWMIETLEKYLPSSVRTAIDVGSEGEEYRNQRQPWNQRFYDYLDSRNIKVNTMDIEPNTNPHYVHDITQSTKKIGKFDVVFATHLLEHVPMNKFQIVVNNLEQMISSNGFLYISVPNKYPYHARPIDNNWRPTSDELIKPFNGIAMCTSTFSVEHTLPQYKENPKNKMSCALLRYMNYNK